jgi:hypothetical protein
MDKRGQMWARGNNRLLIAAAVFAVVGVFMFALGGGGVVGFLFLVVALGIVIYALVVDKLPGRQPGEDPVHPAGPTE